MPRHTLLLLPGLLNDARLWRDVSSELTDLAHPIVAGLTGADSISALAASVISRAPADRFALAGLSMGGYVALEVVRQAPERVSGLALLDTSARPDTAEATEGRRALMELAGRDFPAVIEKLLPKMFHPAHLEDERIAGAFTEMALAAGKEVFVRQQTAIMGRIDSHPTLSQIAVPTLILCGREDAITPIEVHREMANAIPGARLEIVDECGHLSPLEQPARVAQALRAWIEGLGDARTIEVLR